LDTDVVVRRSEVDLAASLHEPLSNLMSANDLDAISVRCFDLLRSLNTSGCVALAELNSAGAIAGCEGDIPSTIAMMLVRELFGTASWMANPAWIDPSNGEIELAHCTVAPSLVEDVSLRTHFESGIGVGISGRFRRQHVTLLRIGGAGMDELWVSDGDLIATGSSEHLCRTQASVVVPPRQAAALLDRPLGNHLVMVPGMHAEEISTWWRLFVTG
jgi:L-fucose isomerase-like protein